MASGIGILVAERIAAALVEHNKIVSPIGAYPEGSGISDVLHSMPGERIVQVVADQVKRIAGSQKPSCVGMGIPGILRDGVVEDSPNLLQLKGLPVQALLQTALEPLFGQISISVYNDADVVAAGMAATRNHLDRLIRVWTLGNGIGYGRYPFLPGIWEAGHMVVSLDPKEQFCGCGGKGHLEGIMGQRAMRLRFMDLEPEEVFEQALQGEQRCVDFVKRWHRALAAATATSIHLDGPGKFFITGSNSRFIQPALISEYLHEMVKLSPLQGYAFEVVPGGEEIALIGAAVNAEQACRRGRGAGS